MEPSIEELEKKIGINFRDKRLLKTALTHDSYLQEPQGQGLEGNERLEFLGDAVLRLVASKHVYDGITMGEGVLHDRREEFVKGDAAVRAGKRLRLKDFLLMPTGQLHQLDSGKILGDAYEALLGAIFIDQEYETAADFSKQTLFR